MKHYLLGFATLLLYFLAIDSANAGRVERSKIDQVAQNWYRHYAPESKKQAVITKSIPYKFNGRECFHIVSFDKGGFVLVSANDAVMPVLGYGFDFPVPDSITNEAVKGWFDGYARQIDTAFVLNLQADASTFKWNEIMNNSFPKSPGNTVGPLLTTNWDQGWPYNAFCPVDNNGSGGHCYTGCVATAYGQIMNYHNYPSKGIGNLTYTDFLGHVLSADFGSTYYNWNEMPSSLLPSDTNYQAVAELLYHCGVGSNSQYCQGTTTGYYVEEPLLNFFDYAYSTLKYVFRNSFNQPQWDSILTHELNQNRPIYYTASSTSAGHAFVCDGYDDNGYFHFNVGWGGMANGYYLTNNLLFGWYLFNMNQTALIGIKPNDGSNISVDSTFSDYHHITTSLYFSALATVKFNPGTKLAFDSGCRLKIGGSVQSNGMPGQPVTFTAYDSISGWGGIIIHSTYYMLIKNKEPDTLFFENTIVSYSKNAGIEIIGAGGSNTDLVNNGVLFRNSKIHHNNGLGISGNFTKISVDSCQIFNNNGGVKLDIGWLDVKNSSLQYNNGTAIYYHSQLNFFPTGNSRIINNVISHNVNLGNSGETPGGVYLGPGSYFDPTPVGPLSYMSGNTISENTGNPGGIRFHGNTIAENNKIFGNTATYYGGGVMIADGATLINNEIYNNSAIYGGGAVFVGLNDGKIINNLIYNNNSGIAGAGTCIATLINNTIVNNGSGIFFMANGGLLKIKNNILWNQGIEINASANQVNVSRSIVKGGTGNIYATTSLSTIETIIKRDPGFINPTTFIGTGEIPEGLNWGLHLKSPAIDAAVDDTTGLYLPQLDTYDHLRFNRSLDIGALENQSDTIFPCFIEDGFVLNGCAGNLVHLTIPYRGENCQFEWYHNYSINLGVNNDTLTISSLSEADSGKYFCIVSNPFGKDTSDVIRVNVFLLPPGNPSVIHGHDTIHHFEKELIYWTNNIPNCTKLQWIASPGLSFYSTNDTTINLRVVDTISSGFIKFFGQNPCGTSTDTASINLTVLRMPEKLIISGDSSLCAGLSYNYWENRYTTDFNFQFDGIQWDIPNGLNAYVWFEEGYLAIYDVDSLAQSDTLKARWVKNGYGVGQWSPFPIRIFPVTLNAPNIIYGPDSVCIAGSNTFWIASDPFATSYDWQLPSGFQIIDGAGTDSVIVIANYTASAGLIRVKAINECHESLYTQDSVHISQTPNLHGHYFYNNSQNSILDSVVVIINDNGQIIDSVRSSTDGQYSTGCIPSGSFQVNANTSKPWSGVNGTDALKIQRHFAGIELLTEPVRLQAADVNNSNSINGTDALKIKRRFAGLDTTFTRGNWTFAKPVIGGDTIVVNGMNVTQDFYGLCVGDVNGSNVPSSGMKSSSGVLMSYSDTIFIQPEQEFELPVWVDKDLSLSAVSLVVELPAEDIKILDVKMNSGTVIYHRIGNELRIAWSELQALELKQGETLISIRLKVIRSQSEDEIIQARITDECELADVDAKVLRGVTLKTKTIKVIGSSNPSIEATNPTLTILPNPNTGQFRVQVSQAVNGFFTLSLFDNKGVQIKTLNKIQFTSGLSGNIDFSGLAPGIYLLRLSGKSITGYVVNHEIKIVLMR